MERIVVTGATSMIGVSLIKALLKNKEVKTIYAVARKESNKLERLPKDERLKVIECNLDEYDFLPNLIKENCDVFYHLAWDATGINRDTDIYRQSENISFALCALNVAHKLHCKKFVGAGSQAEYGNKSIKKLGPNSPINPVLPYGIAKYATGKLCFLLAQQFNMVCIWVRIFSVYGKYDRSNTMLKSVINSLLQGKSYDMTKAEQKWDYLYCDDAGSALELVGEKCEVSKVYCLGSGKARPLYEYVNIIEKKLGIVDKINFGVIPYSKSQVMYLCADISELTNDTGWQPKTSFSVGINKIISNN